MKDDETPAAALLLTNKKDQREREGLKQREREGMKQRGRERARMKGCNVIKQELLQAEKWIFSRDAKRRTSFSPILLFFLSFFFLLLTFSHVVTRRDI